jgi:hypothetical protein
MWLGLRSIINAFRTDLQVTDRRRHAILSIRFSASRFPWCFYLLFLKLAVSYLQHAIIVFSFFFFIDFICISFT